MRTAIQLAIISPTLPIFCSLLVTAQGSTTVFHNQKDPEPELDYVHPSNLAIEHGSDASFTCVVRHLGEYKVAWIRAEDKAIIALHNHMVTHNHRFNVTYNGHDTSTLHIKNVQHNDSGAYMCQVNSDTHITKRGTLKVIPNQNYSG